MATATYIQEGDAIDYTPTADLKAGGVIVQNELIGVAKRALPANRLGSLSVAGVFDFPKATGTDTAIDAGINFIDTADAYVGGVSEEIVGRWIKGRGVRDQVVLATKVYGPMSDAPNDRGLSRIHIQRGVEASLRRLQTDVIDLYQIHRWCLESEPEETLEALNDLVRQGKVRYIGCSNLKAWHLAKYLKLSGEKGWSRFISIQPIYSALNRSIENEVLELCAEAGLIKLGDELGGLGVRLVGDLPEGETPPPAPPAPSAGSRCPTPSKGWASPSIPTPRCRWTPASQPRYHGSQ